MRQRVAKIAFIDPEMRVASAKYIIEYFAQHNVEVQFTPYIEGVNEDAQVVVADPRTFPTDVFVETFHAYNKQPLIVCSDRSDILTGTRKHSSVYALSKPHWLDELAECVEIALEGDRWKGQITESARYH